MSLEEGQTLSRLISTLVDASVEASYSVADGGLDTPMLMLKARHASDDLNLFVCKLMGVDHRV